MAHYTMRLFAAIHSGFSSDNRLPLRTRATQSSDKIAMQSQYSIDTNVRVHRYERVSPSI